MIDGECYLLGIDCGTTNIKAVILSSEGEVIAETCRSSHFLSDGPNIQEQDANEWWRETVGVFRSLAAQVGNDVVSKIKGISISSHTVTMLPVDEKGTPLRNAITYQDGRSSGELYEILDRIGRDRFIKIVGGQPSVAFLPNKLLWYKRHEPELFAKTHCFLQASSYINYKLTGKMTMDIDQASRTQCLDMKTMKWSKEIGEAIGIDLDRYLPQPQAINDIIGFTSEESAKETHLIAGIPVLAGCSDAMASMYAIGLSHIGEAGESSGTTSLVFVGTDQKSKMDIPVVTKPCAIEGMPWIFDAPIQTSGGAINWFINKMAMVEKEYCDQNNINIYDYLNEMALEAEAGSGGLMFFPYLLGERAPIWNEYAQGMFIGLNMSLDRKQLVRSVFEGTSFALRHVVETIRSSGGKCDSLRICGGGAKSRTWAMIKASMLHCPVKILDEKSGDVPVGDALLAGNKLGVFPNLTEVINKVIRIKEVIEPNEEWMRVYDRMYPFYVSFYQSLDQELKQYKNVVNYLPNH